MWSQSVASNMLLDAGRVGVDAGLGGVICANALM